LAKQADLTQFLKQSPVEGAFSTKEAGGSRSAILVLSEAEFLRLRAWLSRRGPVDRPIPLKCLNCGGVAGRVMWGWERRGLYVTGHICLGCRAFYTVRWAVGAGRVAVASAEMSLSNEEAPRQLGVEEVKKLLWLTQSKITEWVMGRS